MLHSIEKYSNTDGTLAYLRLIEAPDEVKVSGLDAEGRRILPKHRPTSIGRASDGDIVIAGLVIGGRRNAHIHFDGKAWQLTHAGHTLHILVNRRSIHGQHTLQSGDTYQPVDGQDRGPIFMFCIDQCSPPHGLHR